MLAARDRAVISLLLESGVRLQGLLTFARGMLTSIRRVVVRFGKLGKSRLSGFGPQTRKALWRQVVGYRRRETTLSRGIQEIFRRLKREAGLDHVRGLCTNVDTPLLLTFWSTPAI
jgi:site-specific recombinase XerD